MWCGVVVDRFTDGDNRAFVKTWNTAQESTGVKST
jgi:hypothetical protein